MRQIRMYIDGYNFYYSIKQKYHLDRVKVGQESWIGLGWCDFRRLGEHMIDHGAEQITDIKYFTARVEKDYPSHAGERQRQQDWLSAVGTINGLRCIMGYLSRPRSRSSVDGTSAVNDVTKLKPSRKEHHTDVNIAVEILLDALDPKGYQKAILVTGDTDLAPAVYAVQKGMVSRGLIRSAKTVDVWSPPGVSNKGWRKYFEKHSCRVRIETITESMLAESLLPYSKPQVYDCPAGWRLPQAYLEEHVPDGLRPDIVRSEKSAARRAGGEQ